jgi:scyllo-inositol 2-dehydrogenase (NADP+)
MIRMAIVGLGKMGLSHLAMLRAHPDVELVGVCDSADYLREALGKYTGLPCYADFDRMLETGKPEAVLIATPSSSHTALARKALNRKIHVFCEKPFVLKLADGEELVSLAEQNRCVNQVGYHYRFVGAFREAARIVRSGALGRIHHVRAEAYGPVVLRAKGSTWRSQKNEGGGALYDYACHAIDLVHFIADTTQSVSGVIRNSIFSADVDDEIYCTMHFAGGATGQLCVNWSDESYRKMSTRIAVWGTNGKVVADRQECQIYLRSETEALPDTSKGWTVRYTTELTEEVWFYLRGEEYSAQLDYWIESIKAHRLDGESTFRSALSTDRVVAMISGEASRTAPVPHPSQDGKRGLLDKITGGILK